MFLQCTTCTTLPCLPTYCTGGCTSSILSSFSAMNCLLYSRCIDYFLRGVLPYIFHGVVLFSWCKFAGHLLVKQQLVHASSTATTSAYIACMPLSCPCADVRPYHIHTCMQAQGMRGHVRHCLGTIEYVPRVSGCRSHPRRSTMKL
jgi:hypothetical protein